ncbi:MULTISPECIES: MFS transporter [unclassified Bifidobacterium]|uniref:MFS transporter n=1 Tax=unclassified Bifidobacterium TaxID=2608897 RepID=UPI0023F72B3E|nr:MULTISPECIES: MFS transporter [unclassified Bifidobacterium]WEV65009.1 MFS transporter [Bifidobacterium sp. ESL0764]WEV76170.1 MFS transporter [Bifidobacterium sp. ESL0800]
MSENNTVQTKSPQTKGSKATIAIILVTSLFFIWGLTMNLVNALDSPFGHYMQLSHTKQSLLQVAYYGAYFIMAIPASMISKRFGYKGGVISGLVLFAVGAFTVIPATNAASYGLFLFAMFVIALGASSLETNCNPYITKLGDEKGESFRLNLAQSFNGVGNVVGPLILGQILSKTVDPGKPGFDVAKMKFLSDTRMIYIVIGIILILVLLVFVFFKLPTPPGDEDEEADNSSGFSTLIHRPYFVLGVLAEFIFIGLQVAGMAIFSAYALKHWGAGISAGLAASMLALLSVFFTAGRFLTTPLMARFDAGKILGIYMTISAVLMVVAFLGLGKFSVICFMVAYLFISIGYPTIFSLTIKGMHGNAAKTGSSALTMSIVGAALIPLLLGAIQDAVSIEVAVLVMVPGFLYVAWYAIWGSKIGLKKEA